MKSIIAFANSSGGRLLIGVDDRMEVTSPGMLYNGLKLEEAMSGRSKIRNRAIAEIFSRMDLIEEWEDLYENTSQSGNLLPNGVIGYYQYTAVFRCESIGSREKSGQEYNRKV